MKDDTFEIPVLYKGEELCFTSKLIVQGYTHKIHVEVNGQPVMFEPDEERKYRAILDASQMEKGTKLDIELLKAIAGVIESVIR